MTSILNSKLKTIPTATRQDTTRQPHQHKENQPQTRSIVKKNTGKKCHKKVTFWDAPQANKAPPNTVNQSNQVSHPGVHPQPNQALFNVW